MNRNRSDGGLANELLGDLELRQYLEVFRRRKPWILIAALSVFTAAAAYAFFSPNLYHSETVILVDPQQVPSTLVPPTIMASVTDRLSTIRQEVLSPTRLSKLIHESGLYSDMVKAGREEVVIANMQEAIHIEVADAGSQRLSAFKIGYTGRKPSEVAMIANELARVVIDGNLRARQTQSSGTRQFLESELEETKKQLEMKEAELGRIKTANVLELPESRQYNLEKLTNLRVQLNASEDRVNRAHQQRIYLQSLLAGTTPTVDLDAEAGAQAGSPYQSQIQKLEARLAELRSRYGPSFPEVRKVQKQLEDAKVKAAVEDTDRIVQAPAQPRPSPRPPRNPVIEAQINKLNQDIDEQTKLQKALQEQIDFHVSKLEREPIFEQRIASLMRDYDTLRAHYNQLLDKKITADMSGELEDLQKGERFVVLDPAPIPTTPSAPRRALISLGGLLGGIIVGIGLAVTAEMADPSVRTDREATDIVGKPLLAGIPLIVTASLQRRNRMLALGVVTVALVCSAGFGFIASYLMRQTI